MSQNHGAGPTGAGPRGPAVPAATVVAMRDGEGGLEILMLRRSSSGAFGGMWVFPGGKVDPGDLPGHPAAGDEIAAARRAAAREAREEAGIELDPASLVVLSFWQPPPETPRRFATWFFLAPPVPQPDVVVDLGEIREHRWIGPRVAMALRDEGMMDLAPPTFTTLWWLDRHADTASALAAARSQVAPERFETHIALTRDGQLGATLWAGDAGYEDGDMYRPGPRRRLVMEQGAWRVEIDSWPS
jgi:8-oxo-dGTP pyrophosphatase MutT (NUDIX family)